MVHDLTSKFFFSLKNVKPQERGEGGNLTFVNSSDMPGLVNFSFANLTLKKRGFLKPIWHPNAHKIGYGIQGKCLVTIRSPETTDRFTVEEGEIFFIPQGFSTAK